MSMSVDDKSKLKCRIFDVLYERVLADDVGAKESLVFVFSNLRSNERGDFAFMFREYAYEEYLNPRTHVIKKRRILRFFEWFKVTLERKNL